MKFLMAPFIIIKLSGLILVKRKTTTKFIRSFNCLDPRPDEKLRGFAIIIRARCLGQTLFRIIGLLHILQQFLNILHLSPSYMRSLSLALNSEVVWWYIKCYDILWCPVHLNEFQFLCQPAKKARGVLLESFWNLTVVSVLCGTLYDILAVEGNASLGDSGEFSEFADDLFSLGKTRLAREQRNCLGIIVCRRKKEGAFLM